MVIDKIENCKLYFGMHSDFERAFRWLCDADIDSLSQRRYVLEEGKLWVTVQRYTSKPREECSVEGHEKYIDIQYVVRGCETVGYENRKGKRAVTEYDKEHDIQFFEDLCDFITIPSGTFYIAGPEDLHMTKCMSGTPSDMVKLVMKVKC
ncbi:MAG: YhcH/YjgK/YiaL family protein [Oscillospiraceae bacterium]